jgi:hypothetical protein
MEEPEEGSLIRDEYLGIMMTYLKIVIELNGGEVSP